MYDTADRKAALAQIEAGASLRAVSVNTGINRATLREWRERGGAYAPSITSCPCPSCDDTIGQSREPYTYLLGQYLGDGSIQRAGRSHALRVFCCDDYPAIMNEVEEAMKSVVSASVFRVHATGCTVVQSNTKRWLHLFPQHGPGMKHTRSILLEPWQQELVHLDPKPLIRGLIHSDGWRGTNWTEKVVAGELKRYTYPHYQFSNESADIKRIFTDALDQLGIAWRVMNLKTISIARREAVAALDGFVGPKS